MPVHVSEWIYMRQGRIAGKAVVMHTCLMLREVGQICSCFPKDPQKLFRFQRYGMEQERPLVSTLDTGVTLQRIDSGRHHGPLSCLVVPLTYLESRHNASSNNNVGPCALPYYTRHRVTKDTSPLLYTEP